MKSGSFSKELEFVESLLSGEVPGDLLCGLPGDNTLVVSVSDIVERNSKDGLLRSVKRKAASSPVAGPSGVLGLSPPHSDVEETPVRSVVRRRRIVVSDDVSSTPHAERYSFPASRIKIEPHSDAEEVPVILAKKDDGKTTRSGKALVIDDSGELVSELVEGSEDELDIINASIGSLGDSVLDNLMEIDRLRVKSKKLQGPISGRMKKLLQRSRESVSTMIGRISINTDIAFLRMRNRELSNDYKAMEIENQRLKVEILKMRKEDLRGSGSGTSSRIPLASENKNDFIDNSSPPLSSPPPSNLNPTAKHNPNPKPTSKKSLPPPLTIPHPSQPPQPPLPQRRPRLPSSSTAISPLPSSVPPTATPSEQGEDIFDFNTKADRFYELKNDMLQMVENMSIVINKYFEVMDDNDSHSKTKDVGKKKIEGRSKKLRIIAQEEIPQKMASKYRELITNKKNKDKNDEADWTMVESKRKKVKKKLQAIKSINDDIYRCEQVESAGESLHAGYPSDVDPSHAVSMVEPERRRKRINSINTPVKRRLPTTSAVLITGKTTDFSYSEALKAARRKISLKDIGIDSTRIRQSFNGGMLIQITGEDKAKKADELANKLNEVLSNAIVTRPIKRADIRIFGFDGSVSVDEIKYSLADKCDTDIDQIKVGAIRSTRNGGRVAWATLPLEAALKLENSELKLGWSLARFEVMGNRPLQCFRCWEFGHSKYNCNKVDRSNNCFKCSEPGHLAKDCNARLSCIVCKEAKFESSHRIGGRFCQSAFGSNRLKPMSIRASETIK